MKRRALLTQSAIAAGSAASLIACGQTPTSPPSNAASGSDLPKIRWRMVTSWPESLETIFGGAKTVCAEVAAMTGGNFTIEPYAAGESCRG